MKRLTPIRAFLLSMTLVAGFTFAQSKVDQGKPGNQGPWPVTITGSGTGGGSGSSVVVTDSPCLSPRESVLVFDGGNFTPCPVSALAGRRTVTFCNSPRNAGSPIWTIRADGLAPTTASNTAGQDFALGDCVTYWMGATSDDGGSPTNCISDTGSSSLKITECK